MKLFGSGQLVQAAAKLLKGKRGAQRISDDLSAPPPRQEPQAPGDLEERQITSDPREGWYLALPYKLTPMQCLQIMRAALGGDIWQQWQLLALMLDTWPTFRMAQHQLREAVSYTKFNFNPYAAEGQEPTPEAVKRAGIVNLAFKGMAPNPFNDEKGASGMLYDFCDAMLNGLSMSELVWDKPKKVDGGGWVRLPRAAAWVHPRHFTFSQEGHVAVFDDSFSRSYNKIDLQFWRRGAGDEPDPDRFVCSQFVSRSGSCLGAGFVRPLIWYWAARQYNCEWMLNQAQKYGAPFIDVAYKAGSMTEDELAKLDSMMKLASSSRRLRHPDTATVQIHPAQTLGTENPQRYLTEEADKACLFLLLGQSGTTMQTPGKLGQEGTHADVKDERVMGLANWVARNPLRQFARAALRVNCGDDELCPNIEPDFTKALDSAQVAVLSSAVTSSRIAVRADEFYKKIGFTQPQQGDLILQNGRLVEMSEPVTQDELAEMEQEAAAYQQAVQMSQQQPQGKQGKSGEGKAKAVEPGDVRSALVKATDKELDELEELVKAAESAEEKNGEARAVGDYVGRLGRKVVNA